MEDVLYDIYLAESEIDLNYQVFGGNLERKKDLFESIYKKHNITPQQFDTSLVWYGAHLDDYLKIYTNLEKRYSTLSDTLSARMTMKEEAIFASGDDDVENLLRVNNRVILSSLSSPVSNTFVFKIDTTLNVATSEVFELSFEALGLNDRVGPLVATLCIVQNDSVLVARSDLSKGGKCIAIVNPEEGKDASEIYGSIHIPDSVVKSPVYLHNIKVRKRGTN